jgi:uncharacterized protein
MFRRIVGGLVDAAGRRPLVVLLLSLLFMCGSWGYARKLELRSDFLELLPRDSPGFKAFEHQLGRVGGGATFLVVVESPDRAANERIVDDLGGALQKQADTRAACVKACADAACKATCGPDFISYVESGTKDLQAFFDHRQWLYASLPDLIEADNTLDHQIAIKSGMVDDLEAPDVPAPASVAAADAGAGPADGGASEAGAGAAIAPPVDGGAVDPNAKQPTLGMDKFYDRWKTAAKKHNDFPTGYFTNDAGTVMVIRIVSNASGTGGYSGDLFLADMTKRVDALDYKQKYHPQMKVGFAGDIPNAVAEKESTVSEAAWASGLAFLLILAGIVVYYRSGWSLLVISVPALMGVGAAYAFAAAVFGYVNTPGAFLGAIILGNGINYPIVLLSRYREFRARGMAKEQARREAVLNAFRAELVGASVASIAYGSLTITQFRGFSQFGTIGFVGMLLVWAAIVPVVPAMIVSIEWIQDKLPSFFGDSTATTSDGSSGPIMRFISRITARWPAFFILVPLLVTAFFITKLPNYLRDPWEYNFSKLGSRSSKVGGAGEWSNKADEVFRGKQNISGTLILADKPEQVPALEAQILANDSADPQGKLIDEIVTVEHFLPGNADEQKKKLAVLDRMRDRLTPRVLSEVSDSERARLEEMKPPDDLAQTLAKDLPPLIRRRFEENNGVLGTLMYIKYQYGVHYSDGRTLLRMAKTTDNVKLPDGAMVQTASRSTIFAEMIRSMERDGPLATGASFLAVMVVVILATRSKVGTFSVLLALLMGVASLVGLAAYTDTKLNFFNFIALPITFGIGCEYPFNIFDRTRLLKGDVTAAVARSGGAVALCSYTTTVGYGSMLFSDNQALQSFGRLAMWGEIACTITALLFLPSLLHVLLGTRRKKAVAA